MTFPNPRSDRPLSGWRPTDLAPASTSFFSPSPHSRPAPLVDRSRPVLAVFAAVLRRSSARSSSPAGSSSRSIRCATSSLRAPRPADHPGSAAERPGTSDHPHLLAVRRASRAGSGRFGTRRSPPACRSSPIRRASSSSRSSSRRPFPMAQAAGIIAALRVLVALVFTYLFLIRQGLGRGRGSWEASPTDSRASSSSGWAGRSPTLRRSCLRPLCPLSL